MTAHFISAAMQLWSHLVPLAHAAADYVVSGSIPGNISTKNDIAGTIVNLYQFGMVIAGVLAFGTVVWAGIRISVSRGNPSTQSDARNQILMAFLGILLLAGAYIILYTLNPGLTKLQLPELSQVNVPPPGLTYPPEGQASSQACQASCVGGSWFYDNLGNPKCSCERTNTGDSCTAPNSCQDPSGSGGCAAGELVGHSGCGIGKVCCGPASSNPVPPPNGGPPPPSSAACNQPNFCAESAGGCALAAGSLVPGKLCTGGGVCCREN